MSNTKQSTNIAALKAQAGAIANVPDEPYPALAKKLNALDGQFLQLLGTRAEVERFKRVVLNAVALRPELLAVEPRSLLAACMRAANDGLMPDGRESVLNVYNVKVKRGNVEAYEPQAQYLPMVAGIIKRLYASGAVTYVDAAAVYENEHFDYVRGDESRLTHRPYVGIGERGELIAAYVCARLRSGEMKREVMARDDIERVRKASKSADKGPWKDWFDQMAIKSVIKRLAKQIDADKRVESVIEHDNDAAGYESLSPPARAQIAPPAPPPAQQPQPPIDAGEGLNAPPQFTQAQLYDMIAADVRDAESADDLDVAADLLAQITDDNARNELSAQIAKRREGMA